MWTATVICFIFCFGFSVLAAKSEGKLSTICTILMILWALAGAYGISWNFEHELVEINNVQE
jgi:hypothetical protein